MFELFSRMAKRPTLTKLDDDGETQMDMCEFSNRPRCPCGGSARLLSAARLRPAPDG